MKRKSVQVHVVPTCSDCWYAEPVSKDVLKCFGHLPQVLVDEEGNPSFVRCHVEADDKTCPLWKPRHNA